MVKEKQKKKKGSILVFSLIIMFIILSAAVGLTMVTITHQKTTLDTSQSTQAFQVANGGIEKFLNKIKSSTGDINTIFNNNCSNNQVSFSVSGGTAKVTFYDSNNQPLSCSDSVSSIDHIKSVGEINNTKRAVQVAIAAGDVPSGTITGGCTIELREINNKSHIDTRWGEGCKEPATKNIVYCGGEDSRGPLNDNNVAETSGYKCGEIAIVNFNGYEKIHCLCIKK